MFWVKIAAFAIVVFVAVISIAMFIPGEGEEKPKEPPKTIYDMAREDKKKILAEPGEKDFVDENQSAETERPAEPIVLYFRDVSEIEKIEAERLMQMVPSFRTIGRMPFTSYNVMAETCRQIMDRWPGSEYDYKARRALGEIPEHYLGRLHIKKEEIDLEYFKTQRPNTKPYTIKEDS
jgi:hypothetical protein